jgi:transcription elongation GreA/GreB family factor
VTAPIDDGVAVAVVSIPWAKVSQAVRESVGASEHEMVTIAAERKFNRIEETRPTRMVVPQNDAARYDGSVTKILNKKMLRDELLEKLRHDLEQLETAHRASRDAATHAEAKPENPKDTRALELTYLARGQAMRVEELTRAVAEVSGLSTTDFSHEHPVGVGALVTLSEDDHERVLFLVSYGGGTTLAGGVQVVTPTSPLGAVLVGRLVGDVVELMLGGRARTLEIIAIT